MKPNKKQWEKLHWFLDNNSSAIWNQQFGWYSDGSFVCNFYWCFDESKENCKLTINTDGSHY
tara:strand:+ start:10593 stop:10778 length:186 start_codon:yes stop_codon:yes gene_type:complete